MHNIFINSEIQNIELIFNAENPQTTTTDVEQLTNYCCKAGSVFPGIFTPEALHALLQMQELSRKMQSPLKNGDFAYWMGTTPVNLSFLYLMNYPDKMSLGEMIVILRQLRHDMTQNILEDFLPEYKKAAKTIDNWIYFLENL